MTKRPPVGARVSFYLDDIVGQAVGISPFTGAATGTVQGETRLRTEDGSRRLHLEVALDPAYWPTRPHPGFPEEGHTYYVLPEQLTVLAIPSPQASRSAEILGPRDS